jgi:hypothetical protein
MGYVVFRTYSSMIKGAFHHRTGHEGADIEEVKLYLYHLINLGAKWGGWSTQCPNSFNPGKDMASNAEDAGWSLSRFERERNKSHPLGFQTRTVQHVASSYTYCVIPVVIFNSYRR